MISTRSAGLLIDTVVCLTLAKWETVSGRFGGYLTGVDAYLAIHFRDVSPVTHQPADFGNVAGTGCHGNRMARRHSGQLQPPTDEKSILADEQGVRRLAPKICEGGIDFAAGAGIENLDLQSYGGGRRLHLSQRSLGAGGIGGGYPPPPPHLRPHPLAPPPQPP